MAAKPFTVAHFRSYARSMVLDNGEHWTPAPFQLEVVEDLFTGVPELWLMMPEGNAKTTLMAGIALYMAEHRPASRLLVAAASRDQAEILFDQASEFVRRSEGFADRFKVLPGYRKIRHRGHLSGIKVMAADDRTGDGVLFDLAFIDEGHRARDMRLYRTWRGKLDKRPGAQLVAISTAGEPGTEFDDACHEAVRRAVEIKVDGCHTRASSPGLIYHDWSVPADGDVEDLELVKSANPLPTITTRTLGAKRDSPVMTLAHWRRFTCNQAVRMANTAIDPISWAALVREAPIPHGEAVSLGLDLGWRHDTTAIVPLWMCSAEERVIGKPAILIPPRDGTSLSPALVKDALRAMAEHWTVRMVVMDPDRGAEVAEWITDELGVEVVEHSQTHAPMCLAYERFMEAIRNGWLRQPGDPEFSEHVLNAIAKVLPDGRTRFERPSLSRANVSQRQGVIDALVAAAMVHSVCVAGAQTVNIAQNVW